MRISPKAKKWLLAVAKLAVVVLVAWFIRKTLRNAGEQITDSSWQLHFGYLVLAGGFYILGLVPAGWFWHRTLRALGQDAGFGETVRAYCIGHLGKYVPGKAMVVILRAGLIRSHRVHTGIAAASVFFETLTMMAVGSFLAAGVLTWRLLARDMDLGPTVDPHWVLVGTLAMMVTAGVPTLPPVFRYLVGLMRVGKSDPEVRAKLAGLGYATLAQGWLAMTVAWLLMGCSLWAVFRGMGLDRLGLFALLPEYVAAVALSLVAGFLSMIPAGFGVRDLILVALNVKFFGVNDGQAVVAAALMRVIWLLAELVISAMLYAGVRRSVVPPGAANGATAT